MICNSAVSMAEKHDDPNCSARLCFQQICNVTSVKMSKKCAINMLNYAMSTSSVAVNATRPKLCSMQFA